MKRTIIISLFSLGIFIAHAQSTPEAFLGLLPTVPTIDCNRESAQQSEAMAGFQSQIDATREKLSESIKKEKLKNKKPELSTNIKGQVAAQSGLSEKELNFIADKKTNQSEKDQLVSKSVQSQTGFSMEEMQQVKNMSKADRQKWAMNNYGKVMQNEKQKSESTKLYQGQNASMAALAEEQQSIAQNLQHHYSRLDEMKSNLETVAEQERILLDKKIESINKKFKDVNDGEGATSEDMAKLRQKREMIRKAKTDFCGKVASLNINYLINYHNVLKENILPDLKRQEDINYQIQKTTFAQAEKSSFERLMAVERYSIVLSRAYDYYIPVDKNE